MNKSFCERLKELRVEHKLSQAELAKIISVSDGTICFWENGVNEPKMTYIIRLAEYFNVTTDFLLGVSDSY